MADAAKDPKRMGVLARVARLRRDREEAALAEAGRVRAAREAALALAEAAATRARAGSAGADRALAADPACAQALLWRRVSAGRAADALAARAGEAARRDGAAELHEAARLALLRADGKATRAIDLHRRARRAAADRRDEAEAEDRAHLGRRVP